MSNYLTIDVGGTNIKFAVMNENTEIYEKGEIPTPYEGLEKYLETLKSIYDKYSSYNIEAIAMSAPGKIDSSTGYFYTSGNLKYVSGINLKDKLKEIIPVDFAVENDAKCAALAELWKGSMQGVKNGTVIVLGTGVGGAIIIDGKVYRGSTFAAGEYSFIPTNWNSDKFDIQNMWAFKNGVKSMTNHYASLIGANPKEIDGRKFFDAANSGDKNAQIALEKYCATLASGIFSLQLVLDVERVSIGGGISKQPLLLETLKKIMQSYDGEFSSIIPSTIPEIVTCRFGNDANMIGALYHYLYETKEGK